MKNISIKALFSGMILCAVCVSCGQGPVDYAQKYVPNRAPVIDIITDDLPDGVDISNGMSILLNVKAHDPDGDDLDYRFESAYGSFSPQMETADGCDIVVYTDHIVGGMDAIVKVTVTDGNGVSSGMDYVLGGGQLGPEIDVTHTETPVLGYTEMISGSGYLKLQFNISSRGGYKLEVLDGAGSLVSGDAAWYYYDTPGSTVEKIVYGPDLAGSTTYYCDGEGDYRVRITAKDVQDQVGMQEIPLVVDATPPSIVCSPAGGNFTKAQQVNLTGSDGGSGCGKISYAIAAGTVADPDFSGSGTMIAGASCSFEAGSEGENQYQLKYTAMDKVGNIAVVQAVEFNIDTSAPSVNIANPANGTVVYNTWKITADASDPVSGISKVEFYIDDVFAGNDATAPYEYSWNTKLIPNGSHSLKAVAYDGSGYTMTDDDTVVTVNNLGTKLFGTGGGDNGNSISIDLNGNIYVTGYTNGALDGQLHYGSTDMFIAKYNPYGVKQWTRQLGSNASDIATGIVTDGSGNIYITGYSNSNFDGQTHIGGSDIILVKYNPNGLKIWTVQAGTGSQDFGYGICVDGLNNIYVTGYTQGSLNGEPHVGLSDCFIIKYSSAGILQWTRQWSSTSGNTACVGNAITTDNGSNIYVTGAVHGSLDGQIHFGGSDCFITKYNTSGTKQWTQQFGTIEEEHGKGIAVDSKNNIYVTGATRGWFDGASQGQYDILISKHDSTAGGNLWKRQFGTATWDHGRSISIDNADNIYITGDTDGNLDGNINKGSWDIYIAKYLTNGNREWTRMVGTDALDMAVDITVFGNNEFITGYSSGNLDGQINNGDSDIFLIRYDTNGDQN